MEIIDTSEQISNYTDVNSFLSRILSKFGERDYEGARKMFYAALGNYSRFFDDKYIIRCAYSEFQYNKNNPEYKYDPDFKIEEKTHRQLLHMKFCDDLFQFSKLIFRQNKKGFNYSENMEYGKSYFKVLGFTRLVDYKLLYQKFEIDVSRIASSSSSIELLDYMYHVSFLFGGLWRNETAEILSDIYTSNEKEELKFYRVQSEISLCMSVFGVFRPPLYVEIIVPKDPESVPRSANDTLLYYAEKNRSSSGNKGGGVN